MKSKKHKAIVNDFEMQKSKHLDYLASQMLKIDERNQKLKDKHIDIKFLKLF